MATLDAAIAALAAVPSFRPSIERWATVAIEVRSRWPGDGGLAVPTWAYGAEPPNVFAGAIAKYFQNAVREATLLRRCVGGIAFLPGAAGTVQELFQDACENYYAEPPMVAPMVLVGTEHWTTEVPAWPLLTALARGREMRSRCRTWPAPSLMPPACSAMTRERTAEARRGSRRNRSRPPLVGWRLQLVGCSEP